MDVTLKTASSLIIKILQHHDKTDGIQSSRMLESGCHPNTHDICVRKSPLIESHNNMVATSSFLYAYF
jgi:hypothetical protein